jgi:iron complex transport system substrate-binding protein
VAKKYNKYLDDHVAMVSERTAALATEVKQSVYYIDGRFNKGIYHTVGTGEIQERWISIAGAKLATARDFQGRDIEIAAEKFLTIDPDIIMIGAQNQAEVYDELISDNVLSELSAVKNGKIYRIPQGIFPWCRTGPEGAIQVVWAGKLLHPDLFADIDIAVVARGFYKEFYGTDISDEHLQGILNGQLSPGGK